MLYFLNRFVLQWFGIRLAKVLNEDGQQISWTILKVMPLTGWGDRPYVYWGSHKN